MIDDPEEEAWRDLERRIRRTPISMTGALEAYLKQLGPRTISDKNAEQHFQAGWMAAMKNHRESND